MSPAEIVISLAVGAVILGYIGWFLDEGIPAIFDWLLSRLGR